LSICQCGNLYIPQHDGKSVDEVLNAGKDKAYHLRRLGDTVHLEFMTEGGKVDP